MKTRFIYIGIWALTLASCSSSKLNSLSQSNDDIYYNPKAKPVAVSDEYAPVLIDKQLQKSDNKVLSQKSRDLISQQGESDPRDFSAIQAQYAGLLTDRQATELDTVIYYNDDTGYWANGFSGSSYDQNYAERLVKFRGTFRGVPYWSPLYNDLVFFSSPDWNVYVEGNYAYMFPSWSNPFYNNYMYGPSFNWGMNFNFGFSFYNSWHSPWNYWNSPWNFGYGYPFWGHRGYYPYYHWGHHQPGWPGGSHNPNISRPNYHYGPRPSASNSAAVSRPTGGNTRPSYTGNSHGSTTRPTVTVGNGTNSHTTSGTVTYTRPGNTNGSGVTQSASQNSAPATVSTGTAVQRRSGATNSSGGSYTRTQSTTNTSGTAPKKTVTQSRNSTYTPGSNNRTTFQAPASGERKVESNGTSAPRSNSSYTPSRSTGNSYGGGNSGGNSGGGSRSPRR